MASRFFLPATRFLAAHSSQFERGVLRCNTMKLQAQHFSSRAPATIFSSSQGKSLQIRNFSTSLQTRADVTVNFIEADGNRVTVKVPEGTSVLEAAHQNGLDLEGACEASLACSTCHVYVDENYFDKIPPPVEEEEDMLDLAYGLTSLSRLGCQIILTKEVEGITVTIPSKTRNMLLEKKK